MSEKDPLDDELLRELGLDPKPAEEVYAEDDSEYAPEDETHEAPEAEADPRPSPPEPKVQPRRSSPPPSQPRQAPPEDSFRDDTKNLLADMPIQVVAVLGKKTMTLNEVLALKAGEVVDLRKLPQEMVDLVANGRLIARGELVLVDGKVGIQIKKVVSS